MRKEKREGPCEYPGEHHPDCNGIGSTKDHITPKCIGKILKWSQKEKEDTRNIQFLSEACHRMKDKETPYLLALARKQKNGGTIFFGEHQRLEDKDLEKVFGKIPSGPCFAPVEQPQPEIEITEEENAPEPYFTPMPQHAEA